MDGTHVDDDTAVWLDPGSPLVLVDIHGLLHLVVRPCNIVGRRVLGPKVDADGTLGLLDLGDDEVGNSLGIAFTDADVPAEDLGKLERLVERLVGVPHEPILDLDALAFYRTDIQVERDGHEQLWPPSLSCQHVLRAVRQQAHPRMPTHIYLCGVNDLMWTLLTLSAGTRSPNHDHPGSASACFFLALKEDASRSASLSRFRLRSP